MPDDVDRKLRRRIFPCHLGQVNRKVCNRKDNDRQIFRWTIVCKYRSIIRGCCVDKLNLDVVDRIDRSVWDEWMEGRDKICVLHVSSYKQPCRGFKRAPC